MKVISVKCDEKSICNACGNVFEIGKLEEGQCIGCRELLLKVSQQERILHEKSERFLTDPEYFFDDL